MTFHGKIAIGVDMFVPERCVDVDQALSNYLGDVLSHTSVVYIKKVVRGNYCPGGLFWSLCIGELAGNSGREALLTPVGCSLLLENQRLLPDCISAEVN